MATPNGLNSALQKYEAPRYKTKEFGIIFDWFALHTVVHLSDPLKQIHLNYTTII